MPPEIELDAKRQKFLAIAREADEEAAKTSDSRNRETWLNLAVVYRVLASELPTRAANPSFQSVGVETA